MRLAVPKPQRCAIYTRKSTEHNLDLEFNSLDAQREACEAYIKSQAHEGWRLRPRSLRRWRPLRARIPATIGAAKEVTPAPAKLPGSPVLAYARSMLHQSSSGGLKMAVSLGLVGQQYP
jgi:hypothetical protein